MASLQISQFADFLQATLPNYQTPRLVSLITDLQKFPFVRRMLQKAKMNQQSGTTGATWKVDFKTSDAAQWVAITEHDRTGIEDGLVEATVPWRKGNTHYEFYDEEHDLNMGEWQLLDLIKNRENRALASWVEKVERTFWGFTAATDTKSPYGLPYFCTKNATEGFTGGIPSGYSSVAGISPTTYSRWNNWAGPYTNVTIDDLVRKARKMAENTYFEAPVERVPELNSGDDLAYATTLNVRQRLEEVAESRNDNLGKDVAAYDGQVTFRRVSVDWAPPLDADTTDPFYQINYGVLKMIVRTGWWQRRLVIYPVPHQRNVTSVQIDSLLQLACWNRRRLGVLATGTTYP